MAAGIYQDPLESLNQSTEAYLSKLDFGIDKTVRTQQQSDRELYEEWKRIFGKIDE